MRFTLNVTIALLILNIAVDVYKAVNQDSNGSCQVTYRHGEKVNVLVGEWK